MSRRPKHVYEIPCFKCEYETKCAKYVNQNSKLMPYRTQMWNDADKNCNDCYLRNQIYKE